MRTRTCANPPHLRCRLRERARRSANPTTRVSHRPARERPAAARTHALTCPPHQAVSPTDLQNPEANSPRDSASASSVMTRPIGGRWAGAAPARSAPFHKHTPLPELHSRRSMCADRCRSARRARQRCRRAEKEGDRVMKSHVHHGLRARRGPRTRAPLPCPHMSTAHRAAAARQPPGTSPRGKRGGAAKRRRP